MAESSKNKQIHPCFERRFQTYLPPLYAKYMNAYVKQTGESESESVAFIIKQFFNAMPAQERERMVRQTANSY